jgi:hypothetical protein
VTADFDVETAVARELVLRLASLLWRLRRATAIETGLLQIQSDILREVKQARRQTPAISNEVLKTIVRFGDGVHHNLWINDRNGYEGTSKHNGQEQLGRAAGPGHEINTELARCLLLLSSLDNGSFECVGRYETALWRQVGPVLLALDFLQRNRAF